MVFRERCSSYQVIKSSLWVINVKERRVEYYDRYADRSSEVLPYLQRYVSDKASDKLEDGEVLDTRPWTQRSMYRFSPKQNDGVNCGVFMLMFARYLARGEPLDFSQQHMEFFRRRIASDVLEGVAR